MQLPTILSAFALLSVASAEATVYLIRHGEKPDSGDGLSTAGQQRAQCLRSVFGASSQYQIGYIMAQTPKSSKQTTGYKVDVSFWQKNDVFLAWLRHAQGIRPICLDSH